MTEAISESSDRDGQHEQPPVDDSVRCPGCETSRRWERFDAPPDDVEAIGTCPACGTHILGFDMITEDAREEWGRFLCSLTDRFDRPPTNLADSQEQNVGF
jgi:rubredoxin